MFAVVPALSPVSAVHTGPVAPAVNTKPLEPKLKNTVLLLAS